MADDDWVMGSTAAQDTYGGDQWVENKPPIYPVAAPVQPAPQYTPEPEVTPFNVSNEQSVAPAVEQKFDRFWAPRPKEENSPVVATTASPLVNITQDDVNRSIDKSMSFSGGGLGIKAYHSSPYDFKRFETSKIGTGEGNQSFGHGLYFAESPAVSGRGGEYWKDFLRHPSLSEAEKTATSRLQSVNFDRERALAEARRDLADWRSGAMGDNARAKKMTELRAREVEFLEGDKPIGPRTYEVDIKADPTHLLNWDKPLREQPHVLKAAPELLDYAKQEASSRFRDAVRPERAQQLLSMAKNPLEAPGSFVIEPSLMRGGKPAELSALMNSRGIPGIQYLDEGSRMNMRPGQTTLPPGATSNYVVFDPERVKILKKYGIAGAAPAGMGALAAQDYYQTEK